ncbi:MAG: 4Fe-4S dicluster domain-containing protein [Hyphomicrobiaceae bacterium]
MTTPPETIVLLCSCEDSMALAPDVVRSGLPGMRVVTARQLCGEELARFTQAAGRQNSSVIVACTAQQTLFSEVAEDEKLAGRLTLANVRETAGWSRQGADAAPKMAALIAAAAVAGPAPPTVSQESTGVTLIYGRDQRAIELAERLQARLDITVILTPGADVTPPARAVYPIRQGRIRSVKGHLGAFEIGIDAYATPAPSSRGRLQFGAARNGAVSQADLLIDVAGGATLVASGELRSGYLRADPNSAADLAHVAFAASDLVGTFDKPKYITFREDLCAHQRSRIKGCTRCLDLCPAGAITPAGDHVAIDANICAGCGQCAAACPTGAASYALPSVDIVIGQLRAMLAAYHLAGGTAPQILVHDGEHGAALIDAAARHGDGLPARTLPLAVNEVTQLGLETIAAAFAYGAVSLQVLTRAKPRHDIAGLRQTLAAAAPLLAGLGYGDGVAGLIETDDPDQLVAALSSAPPGRPSPRRAGFSPLGTKRDVMKLALRELHRAAPAPVDVIALPKGAAFGGLDVRTDGCTLCLACVSACPTQALGDAQDRPRLSFDESLCVQCGLCVATCPEKVITLAPRLDFRAFEAGPRIVKDEEPFCCITCGKAFGVRSTIERVIAKLEGRHWMFTDQNTARLDLIRMCEDCRVEAAVNSNVDPFAGPARPAAKTSEDYFRERAARDQQAATEPPSIAAREVEMKRKIERGEV